MYNQIAMVRNILTRAIPVMLAQLIVFSLAGQEEIISDSEFGYVGKHQQKSQIREGAVHIATGADFSCVNSLEQIEGQHDLSTSLHLEYLEFNGISEEIIEKRTRINYKPDLIRFGVLTQNNKGHDYRIEVFLLKSNKIIGSTTLENRRAKEWKKQELKIKYNAYSIPDELIVRISSCSLNKRKAIKKASKLWVRDIIAIDIPSTNNFSASSID